ncbi:hypothetical protein VTI74DRAFT_5594 [Chaetomium olivicolor]
MKHIYSLLVVIDKPVAYLLNDRDARQRKADKDDELFLTADFDSERVVCPKEQNTRIYAWQWMVFKTYKKQYDFE